MVTPRVAQWFYRCPQLLRPVFRTLVMLGALVAGVRGRQKASGWRGKVRRIVLLSFRPTYVRQQVARRQGLCNQCGACCRLSIPCPFLHENRCAIYGDCRPTVCMTFPIDARDLAEVADQCSYTFGAASADRFFPLPVLKKSKGSDSIDFLTLHRSGGQSLHHVPLSDEVQNGHGD